MEECIAWGRDVSKRFGDTLVFDKAGFCMPRGMSVIWAPNGSGKTTLIRMLLGLLKPDEGRLGLNIDIKRVGVLLDDVNIPSRIRVRGFIEWIAGLRGIDDPWPKAERLLQHLGMKSIGDKRIGELSSGMLKKILIVQALMGKPELVVLDEPFSFLDPRSRVTLSILINDMAEQGTSFLIATHILSLLSPHRIYTISDGKLIGPFSIARKERTTTVIDPKTGEKRVVSVDEILENPGDFTGKIILDA